MPQISLKINERHYEMTCDEGQEAHLSKLAGHLDERIQELVGAVGQVGEGRLLVMASLMVADQLFEAYKEIHELKAGNGAATGDATGDATGADAGAAAALEACAQRIETIAARLAAA
jgi:cell division protein ZapA